MKLIGALIDVERKAPIIAFEIDCFGEKKRRNIHLVPSLDKGRMIFSFVYAIVIVRRLKVSQLIAISA